MFTVTKYGEETPQVILDDNLEVIVESNSPEIKKLIQGFLDHGFVVKSQSKAVTGGKTTPGFLVDEGALLEVEVNNINAFQEFLVVYHGLDIFNVKTN